jgi:hypothetical protein
LQRRSRKLRRNQRNDCARSADLTCFGHIGAQLKFCAIESRERSFRGRRSTKVGSAPPKPTGLLNGEGLLNRDSESFGPKFRGPKPTLMVGSGPRERARSKRRAPGWRADRRKPLRLKANNAKRPAVDLSASGVNCRVGRFRDWRNSLRHPGAPGKLYPVSRFSRIQRADFIDLI